MPKTQVGQPYGDAQANSECASSGTRSNLATAVPGLMYANLPSQGANSASTQMGTLQPALLFSSL